MGRRRRELGSVGFVVDADRHTERSAGARMCWRDVKADHGESVRRLSDRDRDGCLVIGCVGIRRTLIRQTRDEHVHASGRGLEEESRAPVVSNRCGIAHKAREIGRARATAARGRAKGDALRHLKVDREGG